MGWFASLLFLLIVIGALGPWPLELTQAFPAKLFSFLFSWNAPVIGVHCAMQSNGGFTSLVNIGDGFNEISVFLVSEAMAV